MQATDSLVHVIMAGPTPPSSGTATAPTALEIIQRVEEGLTVEVLDRLIDLGHLSTAEIDRLVLPRRTLAHRRANQQRLSPDESDRVVRIAHILDLARDVFEDEEAARAWLRNPLGLLDGRIPLELLATERGARLVEQVLQRIAHGLFS